MKNNKGITLIALVVTIIILLILAGISIAMLTGENGILTNAKKTSTQNEYYGAQERFNLAYMAVRTEIMALTVKDGTYKPEADGGHLASIVFADLPASDGWSITWQGNTIYVKYTNSKIDQQVIDSTYPRKEGEIYSTITLSNQSSTSKQTCSKDFDIASETVGSNPAAANTPTSASAYGTN
jgi:type II secretory pathway pseudopilin PulG